MDRQQTSVNGYIINWALMVAASFTWLRIFPVPLGLLAGIPALQHDLYLQLLASLAFANKIAFLSILAHIFIKRNLAFLRAPLLILAIEAVLNLQLLIVLLVVVSGLTYGFDPSLKSEKDISDGQYPDAILHDRRYRADQ
ncbi:hypothetical protein [Mucilaginibacter pedocola]|uniref:Uncharacterized protein n=1 Tax=Mucilaginibacter pedocola TaxID=1792845 RepID=A0A1S9PC84_9SPHI|nr:hypothetical protein [Mucilaginibacter pedocola]OOQ58427.1 hypothetical protein BC343_07030 [Mucilaginibacter pedocola]